MAVGSIFDVRSSVDVEKLKNLPENVQVVQTNQKLSDEEFRRLGEILAQRPNVGFRIYGWDTVEDLELLRFFPTLKRFNIDCFKIRSFDGLRHLPEDLEYLVLAETEKPLDIGILARFRSLETLYLNGKYKHSEVVSSLIKLRKLALASNAIRDLSVLKPLDKLRALELRLGSALDLSPLPEVGCLRYFEIWMMKGLEDISPIGELSTLRYLFLQDLPRVNKLPSMEGMRSLMRVHIEYLKGLAAFDELAKAPALEEVLLVHMKQVTSELLRGFFGGHREHAKE